MNLAKKPEYQSVVQRASKQLAELRKTAAKQQVNAKQP